MCVMSVIMCYKCVCVCVCVGGGGVCVPETDWWVHCVCVLGV